MYHAVTRFTTTHQSSDTATPVWRAVHIICLVNWSGNSVTAIMHEARNILRRRIYKKNKGDYFFLGLKLRAVFICLLKSDIPDNSVTFCLISE